MLYGIWNLCKSVLYTEMKFGEYGVTVSVETNYNLWVTFEVKKEKILFL